MMDYSVLHDAEINMKVCAALGLGLSGYARLIRQGDATILLDDNKTLVDYCNNPTDAWPIIMKSGINLFTDMIPHGLLGQARASTTRADAVSDCIIISDKNPLRAAMIVFLMMQESANVQTDSAR